MAFDQPQVNGTSPPDPGPPSRYKVRIRFAKAGDLRFLSHHDLMHCFERMFRRCNLPIKVSQGFHPMPRMVFALSLALGVAGNGEILELELDQPVPADEIRQRLKDQAPAGMDILDVQAIDPKTRAQVRRAFYRMPIPRERQADIPARIAAILASGECRVQRSRPQPRQIDVRPYLDDLRLEDGYVKMALWVTSTGTARPDDFWPLLGLEDVALGGAVVERTQLELHDEVADTAGAPNLSQQNKVTESAGTLAQGPESKDKASLRPTSLLPGPLAFDS
jgi:radical SAM-linked protein